MVCLPCSQGRAEDCTCLGTCQDWCCPPAPTDIDQPDDQYLGDLYEENR